ncbi:unnamed protein product [Spirodela intermedia]|uniref:Uncharacterized protein n=1 Tax=Spirodela intermedia TaxID=51605 RepID=A0A7I8IXK0_SPIIN|nr:unnamed protein product [Spirodela intermedia]CAA6662519.1 unnamed protein product [Spirodela intermedia]
MKPIFSCSDNDLTSRKIRFIIPQGFSSRRPVRLSTAIKCSAEDRKIDPASIECPPYYMYMDSTSGQLEPASGARASIPGSKYWPEGTVNRVNAAKAPEPVGVSEGKPSYGKKPGSRRKYKGQAITEAGTESNSEGSTVATDLTTNLLESSEDVVAESIVPSDEYVIYQTEVKEDNLTTYEQHKKLGSPHPFVDPAVKKPIEEPRTGEELWWNWRKPEKEQWSRWQRRRPDVDTVFAKAMAETGQIKLYGPPPRWYYGCLIPAYYHQGDSECGEEMVQCMQVFRRMQKGTLKLVDSPTTNLNGPYRAGVFHTPLPETVPFRTITSEARVFKKVAAGISDEADAVQVYCAFVKRCLVPEVTKARWGSIEVDDIECNKKRIRGRTYEGWRSNVSIKDEGEAYVEVLGDIVGGIYDLLPFPPHAHLSLKG